MCLQAPDFRLILADRFPVTFGDEFVPRSELKRSEFYNDFLVPFGLESTTIVTFTATPERLEVMSLVSNQKDPDEVLSSHQVLGQLLPHLNAACRLRRALAQETARAVGAERALDCLAVAAFLLTATGELLHQNCAATTLIRRRDGISIRSGRIAVGNGSPQSELDALIAKASHVSGGMNGVPGGSMLLPRASGRRALQARILPLRAAGRIATSPASVLMLVTDPEAPTVYPTPLLQVMYGFTASEAEIANRLVSGLSLEQIAAERAVSLGTVRVQLKRMLQKTGTRRQSDLVRLILSVPQIEASSE